MSLYLFLIMCLTEAFPQDLPGAPLFFFASFGAVEVALPCVLLVDVKEEEVGLFLSADKNLSVKELVRNGTAVVAATTQV